MAQPVVFIQGGGIGFDQELAVRRILAAAGVDLDWHVFPAGQAALDQGLPPVSRKCSTPSGETGVALKTKLLHPPHPDENYTIQFRRDLGLFASVRPIRNLRGLQPAFENLDILLVREITEDLYTAIEHEIVPGVVQSIKVVTGHGLPAVLPLRLRLGPRKLAARRSTASTRPTS